MKKVLVTIAALLISVSAYAQGQVNFNTHIGTAVDARVFNPDGTTPAVTGNGQLFIMNGTSFTPLTPVGVFRTTVAGAGYINAGAATAPVGAGTYQIVLRAWQGAASYDAAAIKGQSAPVSVTLTEAPNIPNDLVGLQGFTMTPEPTTLALGAVVGLGALMIRRRKA